MSKEIELRCPDCGSTDLQPDEFDEFDGNYYECIECGTAGISFEEALVS